jgi:hypothetical protein
MELHRKAASAHFALILCVFILTSCTSLTKSADPTRFNVKRQALPDNALDTTVMPLKISNFVLRPSTGWPSLPDASRQFIGVYEGSNRTQILLTAVLTSNPAFRRQAISVNSPCTDSLAPATPFPDGLVPYSFATCKGDYQYNWLSGNWILSAATYTRADSNDLLQFVNSYPY